MSSPDRLDLSLGIRLHRGSAKEAADAVSSLIAEVERRETDRQVAESAIPLYWSFPIAPVLESIGDGELASALRSRISERGDSVVPVGFSGAPHARLLPEELAREISWCTTNPWFSALKALLGKKPEAIMPAWPDLQLEASEQLYSRQGIRIVALPMPLYRFVQHHRPRRRSASALLENGPFRFPNSKVTVVPVVMVRPNDLDGNAVDDLLSALGSGRRLVILLDLPECPDSETGTKVGARLRTLLDELTQLRHLTFLGLREIADSEPRTPVDPETLPRYLEIPPGHVPPQVWESVDILRGKKRKSASELRRVLEAMRGAGTDRPQVEAIPGRDPLQIANFSMGGSVTLIGDGLRATFIEGLLTNLIRGGREGMPGERGRSYLTVDGTRSALQTRAAFSFEGRSGIGLRAQLSQEPEKGEQKGRRGMEVLLDYFFSDELDRLEIQITVSYPILQTDLVQEAAPLELCLGSFSAQEAREIEIEQPGRRTGKYELRGGQTHVLYGKLFRIAGPRQALELEVEPALSTSAGRIELRIGGAPTRRRNSGGNSRGARLLWANLGGSYLKRPAADLAGRRHCFRFSLRLA